MTNLDSILRNRDITLPTKVHLNATLNPDEKDRIWQVAEAHASHNQDWASPAADEVVPQLEPHWTYQPSDPGIRILNHMVTCLLEGMQKNTHIHVSYD